MAPTTTLDYLFKIPLGVACVIICKGKDCKYCDSNWPQEHKVINGIFSDWLNLFFIICFNRIK